MDLGIVKAMYVHESSIHKLIEVLHLSNFVPLLIRVKMLPDELTAQIPDLPLET